MMKSMDELYRSILLPTIATGMLIGLGLALGLQAGLRDSAESKDGGEWGDTIVRVLGARKNRPVGLGLGRLLFPTGSMSLQAAQ